MIKKLILVLVPLILIAAGVYFGKDFILAKLNTNAELKIESKTETVVFVNGENKGKTPLKLKLKPGEYEIKITPGESSLYTFNQKVKINQGTQTYVDFLAGTSESNSSWEIITLEKIKNNQTEVTVSSTTEAAEVFLDGEKKGTTPVAFSNVSAGDHDLRISAAGFFDNPIKIKVTSGYKLSVNTRLAATGEQTKQEESKTQDQKQNAQTMVQIKETPTGFLRVRKEASTSAEEVTRVKPGEKYPLVEEKENWLKIEYEKNKDGWISGQYAEKVK